MRKKKVLISAYVAKNLGDDLFIDVLCRRYPETEFYLFGPSGFKNVYEDLENLKYIGFNKLLWKVLNYNILLYTFIHFLISRVITTNVLITGNLFEEIKGFQKNKLKKNISSHLYNKSFYISSNIGSYQTRDFLNNCEDVFKKIDDVCLRDEYSYSLFSHLNNLRVAPDAVFQLKKEDYKTYPRVFHDEYIVVSVIDLGMRSTLKKFETDYLKFMVNLVEELVNKENKKVVLMSFCEQEGDMKAIDKITSQLRKETRKEVLSYNHENISRSIAIISESSAVVSARFHSFILAYLFGKPSYNIVYSNKTINTMKDISADILYTEINSNISTESLDKVRKELKKNYKPNNDIIKKSQFQFLKLDELLKSK